MLLPRKMLTFAGVLLSGLALTGTVSAQAKQDRVQPKNQVDGGTPLSVSDKKHLLEDNFAVVKTVAAVPLLVQKEILGDGERDGMADAGQPFERTDMLGPKPLPFQRLIFAGTSSGYCFVYSEQGGFAYWMQVSLYRLSAGQAILVWRGTPHGNLTVLDLAQLRDAINKGKLDNVLLPKPEPLKPS